MKQSEQWALFADKLDARSKMVGELATKSGNRFLQAHADALLGVSCDATAVAAKLCLEELAEFLAELERER